MTDNLLAKQILFESSELAEKLNQASKLFRPSSVVLLLALRMFEKTLSESMRANGPGAFSLVETLWDVASKAVIESCNKTMGHTGGS